MAPKKGKKKKKSKKKKAKKEYLPLIYNIPDYEDPELVTPKVDLFIKLAQPLNDVLAFQMTDVPITTRIEYIKKQIQKRHQNGIGGVSICKDRYAKEEVLDPLKTLEQCGILGEGEVKLFYDYVPINSPLLI